MSLSLQQYPKLNSWVNTDCTEWTLKGAHNISVAMDTPRGLIVPNVKNVQDKSVIEIAKYAARASCRLTMQRRELNRLSALGQAGKLGQEDLAGGTISISNI